MISFSNQTLPRGSLFSLGSGGGLYRHHYHLRSHHLLMSCFD